MPITSSAKKAIRVSGRKKAVNGKHAKAVKDISKKIEKLITAGNQEEAFKLLSQAYKTIDKSAKRGVLKKNTAARKKSRLARITKKK